MGDGRDTDNAVPIGSGKSRLVMGFGIVLDGGMSASVIDRHCEERGDEAIQCDKR